MTAADAVLRDNRAELVRATVAGRIAPPRIFAYPTAAWIYLMLPADNPTPFCLLLPRYNTPEQFETAKGHLERDPQAFVFLMSHAKPNDPFVQYTFSRFHKIIGAAYGTLYGRFPRN